MEINNIKPIIDKFKEFREKESQVFDFSIQEKGFQTKEDITFNAYFAFSNSLEKEINSIPHNETTVDFLNKWIDNLEYWINSYNGAKLSETTKVYLKYRKQLKSKLIEITGHLQKDLMVVNEQKEETAQLKNSEKLTLKQQILLLVALGILKKEDIIRLPYTKQAKLVSHLLNRSEKKVKDILTYIDKKDAPADFFLFKDENVNTINGLLKSIDLQEYSIKLEPLL